MKKVFFIISVTIICCLCLVSCSGSPATATDSEVKATVSDGAETEKETTKEAKNSETVTEENNAEEIKFSLDELRAKNKISVLLKNYKSIRRVQITKDGTNTNEAYYFSFEGYPVSAEVWKNEENPDYFFSFNGYSLGYENAQYVMNVYSGPEDEDVNAYNLDYDIVCAFDIGLENIYNISEVDNLYTFNIGSETPDAGDIYCEVSKDDYSVRQVIYAKGTENEYADIFSYDVEVDDFGLTEGWAEHGLKEVTIVKQLYIDGDVADGFETLTVPYNINVKPYSYGDYAIYSDGEYKNEYEYPGESEDYTVYYTNSVG